MKIDLHHGDCLEVLRFGSVCSGIEAASCAWHPLGWRAAWFSEIEPFPSAVLAHHYPETPNLGDMTVLPEAIRSGAVEAPELLCGGTPCQAFSVAGKRTSLADARGNLSLTFCEIADAIDHVRAERGEQPTIVFWENVPGVLSTKDNAFGCFIAALAGGTEPVVPPDRWTDAGLVLGPKRAIAWRVLDAQYFGVAQRRRRVFVVASARKGFDPAAVLFESDGVRRDSPPSREAGKDTAGSTGDGVARCVTAGEMKRQDWETCTMVAQPVAFHPTQDPISSTDGTARAMGTGSKGGCATVAVAFAIQAGALRTNPASGPDGVGVQADHAYTLEARAEVQAVCVTGDVFHTLRAEGFDASEDGTGRGAGAVAVALRGREGGATAELGDEVQNCLRASSGGGDKPHVLAPAVRGISQTLTSNYGKQVDSSDTALGPNVVFPAMRVRRLTPRECERLQGFPDDYTAIPWRGKSAGDCPDGPRYKALGNSWAVPVVAWIGRRIGETLA